MKCNESHCHTCGYDYDDPEFNQKHKVSESNTLHKWSIGDTKPVLDPDLLDEHMISVYKTMEDNIVAQKLCGVCLKPRPENIKDLLDEGWNIVQKPMTSSMDNNTMLLTFHIEQWWLCKRCQENL